MTPRWRSIVLAGLAAVLLHGPGCAETRRVSTPDALRQMVQTAEPGTEILLAPGDYGMLDMIGGGGTADRPVILRAADPNRPAVFRQMLLQGVSHLTLQSLRLDYRRADGDAPEARPFQIIDGQGITLDDILLDGDLGPVSADRVDGLPSGFGLSVLRTQGFVLTGSEIRLFARGVLVVQSGDVALTGNDFHSLRSDGINIVQVDGLRIEGNHLHDFLRDPDGQDHSDMIQFWTAGSDAASRDIVIRDNVLNSGAGLYTQSIFMRNELAEDMPDRDDLAYRNIRIEENVIINAHLHGITIGQADGVVIRNNTVLRNALSSGPDRNPGLWTPQIRVLATARNVVIEANAIAAISGVADRPDWTVRNNLLIQDQRPNEPGFYDSVFMAARTGDPRDLASFTYRPGGPLDGTGIGAARLAHPPAPSPAVTEVDLRPLIRVIPDPRQSGIVTFDARMTRLPDGIDPAAARWVWQFGDGTRKEGPLITQVFAAPGRQVVDLTLHLPDGRRISAQTTVAVQGQDVASFALGQGLTGWVDGVRQTIPLPEGMDADHPLPIGDGAASVTLPKEAMAAFFGANDFALDLRLRRTTPRNTLGEVLRIHDSLILRIGRLGQIEATFATAAAKQISITTRPGAFDGGDWQDIGLTYSATTGLFRILVDGTEMARRTTFGRVKPMQHWGLSLGNPFGKKKSYDGEVAALRLRANTETLPDASPQPQVPQTP